MTVQRTVSGGMVCPTCQGLCGSRWPGRAGVCETCFGSGKINNGPMAAGKDRHSSPAVARPALGSFHWRDGLYFYRLPDGAVRIVKRSPDWMEPNMLAEAGTQGDIDVAIPRAEWESISRYLDVVECRPSVEYVGRNCPKCGMHDVPDPRDYWAQHVPLYAPPSDEAAQRVIDAANATGMPTTALRWALRRFLTPPQGE